MSGDYVYRMFYFFLFAYAAYSCFSACVRGRRRGSRGDDDDENPESVRNNTANYNNNEPRGTVEEERAKRRDVVKSRLEFRKILSSSSSGKAVELGPPLEPDLEMGEGGDNSNPYDNVDVSSLELLSEMGFTINASKKALHAVGGSDTAAAMDWIFDHRGDPNLDADPQGASNKTDPDDSKISADKNRLDSSVRSLLTSSMQFLNRVAGTGSQNEECCSICLEQYQVGDIVTRLKRTPEQMEREKQESLKEHDEEEHHNHDGECNHWFHDHCITEWLQNHDECPLCRVDMVHEP